MSPLRTDTVVIPVIDGEVDTTSAIPTPWLRPPVTRIHRTPRARLASRWQTFRRSRFVAHTRAYGWLVGLVAGALITAAASR